MSEKNLSDPAPARSRSPLSAATVAGASSAAKVPEITVFFWVLKLLTTGTGEAASDYLGGINLALAGGVGVIGFGVGLFLQLRAPRYQAVTYWFAVMMVAVFGTMAADALHVVASLPYAASTVFYAIVLAVVFWQWRRSEGTLSIHSITTRRRECYYWLTVLATFALGTAAGDLVATSLHLGFFAAALLFAGLILVPILGWWRFGLNPVVAFWAAYVLTRPLGASFADWFGKPHNVDGGLGFGDGTVTGLALIVFVALVGYLALTQRDVQADAESRTAPRGALPS